MHPADSDFAIANLTDGRPAARAFYVAVHLLIAYGINPKTAIMEVQKASLDDVFKKYTRLSKERQCFVVDVRPYKDWKRRHLLLSYCVRLSSNGKALVDYSKNRYDQKWAQVCC